MILRLPPTPLPLFLKDFVLAFALVLCSEAEIVPQVAQNQWSCNNNCCAKLSARPLLPLDAFRTSLVFDSHAREANRVKTSIKRECERKKKGQINKLIVRYMSYIRKRGQVLNNMNHWQLLKENCCRNIVYSIQCLRRWYEREDSAQQRCWFSD